ncbi:MAG TPA: bile acid:sodium symporter [Chthoniobacterales bacterium]|nr:bile acid:sodium symporter [Chthoniobacterales bacterium]
MKNQLQPLQKVKEPSLQNWIRANGFIVGLAGVVVLAFFFPDPGARNGWLHAESVSDWGLAVIMLLQGLSMPLEKARQGAGNWRLHILIQNFTFVIFPIVGFVLQLVLPIIWRTETAAIQKGFLYLCVLPSTVFYLGRLRFRGRKSRAFLFYSLYEQSCGNRTRRIEFLLQPMTLTSTSLPIT